MADYGQPKPRHQYTYMPRPFAGQRGALVYQGPLNATGSMTNRAYGMGAMGGMGYGVGYPGYGMGYGAPYGTATTTYTAGGVNTGYPYNGMYGGYGYGGYGTGYGTGYGYGVGGGVINNAAYGCVNNGGYANPFSYYQYPYYGADALPYGSYSYVYPSQTAVVTTTAAAAQTQHAPPVQYTYVTPAATPTVLPSAYYTSTNTTTTDARARSTTPPPHGHARAERVHVREHRIHTDTNAPIGVLHGRPATRDELNREARRIATENGAYRPRRIKPADAHPNDDFWCREREGEWHLRKYYELERLNGMWQMDAEVGFLVFHRED